ncbi:aldehyde dehydrogenase family protein [soil metagenome]
MTIPFTNIDSLYIGNQWVKTAEHEDVLNPATEEVIGRAPVGSVADCEAAIAAARDAFDNGPWPRLTFRERAAVVRRMHDILQRRLPEIHELTVAEVGTTQAIAGLTQTVTPLRHMLYGCELAEAIAPHSGPVEINPNLWEPGGPDALGAITVIKEPVGVVAGITGYNYPFLLNLAKVVPSLLSGCTMVLKPSPFTPYGALLFGEIIDELGLPPGVLNVLTGGMEVSKLLTSHKDVDMISFTGSDTVGALISAQAAPTLKRVVHEMGGKSAYIVRHDADVAKAAMTAVGMFTANCGQGCALLTRYLVHNSIRPHFVEACRQMMGHFKVGDPIDPSVMVGPLIRASQRAKAEYFVQSALDSGATLVGGGKRPEHLKKGFFFEPTLFDNVDNKSEIAQQEIFGPIGVVIGFDTDEEAIRIANDSDFGLAGGILTADRAEGYRMALRLRTGRVWRNGGVGSDMSSFAPFGGYKRSGIGREYGPRWIDEYLHEKVISFPIG